MPAPSVAFANLADSHEIISRKRVHHTRLAYARRPEQHDRLARLEVAIEPAEPHPGLCADGTYIDAERNALGDLYAGRYIFGAISLGEHDDGHSARLP